MSSTILGGTPTVAGCFAAAIAFGFFAVVMNAQHHGWLSWYQLAVSGKTATAVITGRRRETHDTCAFEYRVDSRRYSGSEAGCNLDVGQSATAVYLPARPSFASLRSPAAELFFQLGAAVIVALLAGALAAWRAPRAVVQ
jgi:hypothetical protein